MSIGLCMSIASRGIRAAGSGPLFLNVVYTIIKNFKDLLDAK